MKHQPHDDLLKDTFTDGELNSLREASLNRGIAAQRSRRQFRRLRNSALIAAPALLLVAALFWRTPPASAPVVNIQPIASIPSLKIYPAVNAADAPPMPTISDKELLALYANRSVALLGKPGQQKLVFFDQPAKAVN